MTLMMLIIDPGWVESHLPDIVLIFLRYMGVTLLVGQPFASHPAHSAPKIECPIWESLKTTKTPRNQFKSTAKM